jgi:ribonuclease HI
MSILKYFSKLEPEISDVTDTFERVQRTFTVFTDGSCFNNGKKGAIGGIGVFFHDNSDYNISEPLVVENGAVTNNKCELEAVRRAILSVISQKDFHYNDTIHVYTDSQYLINSVNKWSNTWSKNGWMRKNTKGNKVPVKNVELIKEIKGLCVKYQVVLTHCKAHTNFQGEIGSPEYVIWYGNHKADELAVAGSQQN